MSKGKNKKANSPKDKLALAIAILTIARLLLEIILNIMKYLE